MTLKILRNIGEPYSKYGAARFESSLQSFSQMYCKSLNLPESVAEGRSAEAAGRHRKPGVHRIIQIFPVGLNQFPPQIP